MSSYAVRHPAPLEFVPPRARAPRLAMVGVTTPVSLRTDRLDAYERLDARIGLSLLVPIYRDGDGLWSPIRRRGGDVDESALRRYLAGEAGRGTEFAGLDAAFSATPVLARDRHAIDRLVLPDAHRRREPDWPNGTRGEEAPLDRAREVTRDGRAAAADRLQVYLARNLRIVDGIAFRRREPLAALGFNIDPERETNFAWKLVEGPAEVHAGAPVATPRSFARVSALRERPGRGAVVPPPKGWLDLGASVPTGADARAFANAWAFLLRIGLDDMLAAARRQGKVDNPFYEEALAVRSLMRDAEILALTGSYGANDLGEALIGMARAAASLWNMPRETGLNHSHLPGVVSLETEIREGYLPDVIGEVEPEDDAALSSLSAL